MFSQGFYDERMRDTLICDNSFSPNQLCRMNIIYLFIDFVRCGQRLFLDGYLFFIVFRLDNGLSPFQIGLEVCAFSLVSDEPVKLEK